MATRVSYWSCSKFANWLRGTPKPGSATGSDWSDWHKTARVAHPIRYWLAEEALDRVQTVLWWPIDSLYSIKYYINNRWVTKTHQLTAQPKYIPPGKWRDFGDRILPCLFGELVNFVEVELAWMNIAWDSESRKKYNPPRWAWGWFRWRTWRCPEAGIDYLKWASALTTEEWLPDDRKHEAEPTPQAVAAKEIMELYRWWVDVYPNRPDPHDASGWTEWCESRRERLQAEDPGSLGLLIDIEPRNPAEAAETKRRLDLCTQIEQDYEKEDTEMLTRLIKVRGHLWT